MLKKIIFLYIGFWISCSIFVIADESLYSFESDDEVPRPQKVTKLNSMSAMRQKILEQQERIDGLTTVVEGLSASVNELRSAGVQSSSITKDSAKINEALLKKLAEMIDDINKKYVSRDELTHMLGGEKNKSETEINKIVPKEDYTAKSKSSSSASLYSEGVRHFMKHQYSDAKKCFSATDVKGYKSAASNYYLGEISYYTKQYEDAIFYYRKSAGIFDKASYIDTLLLHTAISLEKTGEKQQAKVFYNNIIENYPTKKTARIAKDKLKRL